jgi:DNA-binding transcriptional MerR regulator
VKVSELSERAGVPLPTIKFYIREGLLPSGARTARNQAEYSEEHLERLALIRALREDAGLGVAAIARALHAADAAKEEFVQTAIDAIQRPSGPAVPEQSAAFKQAKAAVMQLGQARGWLVRPEDLALRDAARALAVIRRSFPGKDEDFGVYAEAADQLAKYELPENWGPTEAPNAALRYAMLGTVLFEPFLLALRRMAHSARVRSIPACTPPKAPAREPSKRKPAGKVERTSAKAIGKKSAR